MDVGLEPGFGHDFHKHPEQDELITVLAGRIEQWIEQEKTILEVGDSVYLDKDVVHASFNVGDVPARLFVVLAPSIGDEGYELVDVASEEPWACCAEHAPSEPLRIAHRGYRSGALENTLEAFAAAIDHGADVLEVDVRRRRDGALVAHHDRADAPDAPLLADVLALAAASRVAAQPRSQGERHRAAADRARARRGPDRPRHLHGRQLGDAGRHPPRRAGHPRRPDDAAAHLAAALRPLQRLWYAWRAPGILAAYDAQVVSCHRELVSRLLVAPAARRGRRDLGLDGRPPGRDRAAARAARRRHLLGRPREPRLGRAGRPSLPD